ARVTAATGRDFTIEGDLRGQFSLTPTVRAEGVRLANAEWAEQPAMVEIAEVELQLDLRELLGDAPTIRAIRIRGARVLLEIDEEGRFNGDFGDEDDDEDADRADLPLI